MPWAAAESISTVTVWPTAMLTAVQLEGWMPREHWQELHPLFVGFGQQVCADRPACHSCPLMAARVCPQIGNLDV